MATQRSRPTSKGRVSGRKVTSARSRARLRAARTRAAIQAQKRKQRAAERLERKRRKAESLQWERFEKATVLFNSGKFGLARRMLERVELGPDVGLAHRARVYVAICLKKAARKRPVLVSVEDFYNQGVKLLNEGKFADAVRVLNRGLQKDKTAAHLHYVKAVAKVLAGQRTGALIPLKKAIALEPDIRILARGDPDLQSVINRPPFARAVANPD